MTRAALLTPTFGGLDDSVRDRSARARRHLDLGGRSDLHSPLARLSVVRLDSDRDLDAARRPGGKAIADAVSSILGNSLPYREAV